MGRALRLMVAAAVAVGLACSPAEQGDPEVASTTLGQGEGVQRPQDLPQEVAALAAQGRMVEALRLVRLHVEQDQEPAAVYLDENARSWLLQGLFADGSLVTGGEEYLLGDLARLWEHLVLTPDVLGYRLQDCPTLPPARFYYLVAVAGEAHGEPPPGGVSTWAMPKVSVEPLLGSRDPWLVAAALFMARKEDLAIDPEAILDRWLGQDPWDQVCTEQALLYLAARGQEEVSSMLVRARPVPDELTRLEPVSPDEVLIEPRPFLSAVQPSLDLQVPATRQGLWLETRDDTMEPVSEREVAAGEELVELEPTSWFFSFRYQAGRMHGESRFVQGSGGTFVRMAVSVSGGV